MSEPTPAVSQAGSNDEPLPEQKLRLETAKLQAEIRNLRRPNPALWITAVVGLLGTGLQWDRSSRQHDRSLRELDLATIRKERTELDLIKLEGRSLILDSLRQLAASRLDSILARGDEAEKRLVSLRSEASKTEAQLAQLAAVASTQPTSQPAFQKALSEARQSVGQIGTVLQQTQAANARSRDSLQIIRAELETVGGLSPGSPVIARVSIPFRAELSYRRWITKEKVVHLGTVKPGETIVELPYGGYIYFKVQNLDTDEVTEQGVDCRKGCAVSF